MSFEDSASAVEVEGFQMTKIKKAASFTLEDLSLDEVSAVDNPANPLAIMALFKSADKTQGDNVMDVNELTKRLEETEGKVESIQKAADDAKTAQEAAEAKLEALTKALGDADIAVEENDGAFTVAKAEEPEYIEVDGERVLKSAIPGPLLKRLEAQDEVLKSLQAEREMEKLTKRAEQMFPNLGGSATEKAEIVKMLDGLSGDAKTSLEKSLKAADAAVAKMFDEVGGNSATESDSQKELDSLVAKYASENSVTNPAAYAEVTKAGRGRELLLAIRKEAN